MLQSPLIGPRLKNTNEHLPPVRHSTSCEPDNRIKSEFEDCHRNSHAVAPATGIADPVSTKRGLYYSQYQVPLDC